MHVSQEPEEVIAILSHEALVVYNGKFWTVYLHGKSPGYLGRMYLWLNRDLPDLMDISVEEREELFVISKKIKEVLGSMFSPDLYNYTALGNRTPHVHVHLIPRYASEREFDGIIFKDDRWGRPPLDFVFGVPDSTLKKLCETIRVHMAD